MTRPRGRMPKIVYRFLSEYHYLQDRKLNKRIYTAITSRRVKENTFYKRELRTLCFRPYHAAGTASPVQVRALSGTKRSSALTGDELKPRALCIAAVCIGNADLHQNIIPHAAPTKLDERSRALQRCECSVRRTTQICTRNSSTAIATMPFFQPSWQRIEWPRLLLHLPCAARTGNHRKFLKHK